jgi:S-(hydroxymethyl)glutathione dehydrogenase/alcohol dehydrogenase
MSQKTQAAVLVELGQPLQIVELGIPELKPGQVLVDVAYSGVCQSQLNEVRGRKGPDRFLPHTLGHEGSGTVAAVGEGVKKVAPGDQVVLSWLKGSGADVPGTVYQGPMGAVNSGAISTFMRRTVTCENRLTPLPANVPLREAALLGCAVPTGAGIVLNTLKLQPGESLVVFGLGGVGLSALLAAKALGAAPLIAVDIVPEKLEMARMLGASHVIDARTSDAVAEIRALTDGKGANYAIEAAGHPQAMESAFEAVRMGGGLCVIAGNVPHGVTVKLNPFSLIAGRRIAGSWGGDSRLDDDIPQYAKMYAENRLPLSKLITAEYKLADINQAFDDLEAGRVARALVAL